jgi:predicted nucleic acid-binding protein
VLLVDTSAWIEIFRRPSRIALDDIIDNTDRVVTCLPVIQEVLQGFDDERAFRIAEKAMHALPCVESPMSRELIDLAVDIYRRARRGGITVRSSVDCIIAACAARHRLTVVHRDRDYPNLARVVALEEIDITPRLRHSR